MPTEAIHRVIVKFGDKRLDCTTKHADEKFRSFLSQLRGSPEWKKLKKDFPGITIKKLITSVSSKHLRRTRQQCIKANPSCKPYAPNLLRYFAIPCPPSVNPKALADTLSKVSWKQHGLEAAYVEGKISMTTIGNPGQNPDWALADTDYLKAAPNGIDAESAWRTKGGDGGNNDNIDLQFVDVENNWNLDHPDLPPGIDLIYGDPRNDKSEYTDHGTAVLGIVVGQNNNEFSLGVTPNVARTMVASPWLKKPRGEWESNLANTIVAALTEMNKGDVLLLEVQIEDPQDGSGRHNLPVEYDRAIFELIQHGTLEGKIIVEAAGNGGNDLDNLPIFKSWLTKTPGAEDSGAIMVSAAEQNTNKAMTVMGTAPPVRIHNYGSRIDCYAWGNGIWTTNAAGAMKYFGDTSGAAAIVAGAALATQGMAEASAGRRLSPSKLRALLGDTATNANTASDDPVNDKIGVMPNLAWIKGKL